MERVIVNRIPLSVQELAEEYGTSEKTLRNDVKEINQFLKENDLPELIISKEGRLIKAKSFDGKEAEQKLYSLDAYDYKLSTTERQYYILTVLLESGQYMTMQNFADELHVSRVTIMHDVDEVKEKTDAAGVDLQLDPGKGMVIHCDDRVRFRAIASIGYAIREDRFLKNFLVRRLDLPYTFDQILLASQKYMKANKLLFVGDAYYKIALYMFSLFNFAPQKGSAPEEGAEYGELEQLLLTTAKNLNVMVTKEGLQLFLEFVNDGADTVYIKSVDDILLYNAIIQFLGKIDESLNLGIAEDTLLTDALLLHIRSMQNWEQHNVELPVDSHNDVINYSLLWELTEKHANILEGYLGYQLSETVRKTIIIHICVGIIRSQKYLTPAAVLLVCPGSRAGGKYLEAQLQSYFNFTIRDVLSEDKEILQIDEKAKDIDFVLSTIPLKTEKCPVYQIHQNLELDDLNLLQKVIFSWQYLRPYENDKKEASLRQFIRQTFNDEVLAERLIEGSSAIISEYYEEQTREKLSLLSGRLRREDIFFADGSPEWREAIRLSAEPLLRAGVVEDSYVENSIQVVEEYGDYIVVSEGVALAHANHALGGVHADGLSLMVCPDGIRFSEAGNKVYLLFFFASTGEQDDLEVLKAIIRLGQLPGQAKRIASQKDLNAVYDTVCFGQELFPAGAED